MKTIKFLIVSLLFIGGISAYSQQAKVIAVVNEASWCPVCKAHGERFMMLMPEYKDKDIVFVMNNLSDDNTAKESRRELEKLGVAEVIKNVTKTGIVTLIDSGTLKIIETVSVSKSDEELRRAFNNALACK